MECDTLASTLVASGTLDVQEAYRRDEFCVEVGQGYTLSVSPSRFADEVSWVLDDARLFGGANFTETLSVTSESIEGDYGGGAIFLSAAVDAVIADCVFNGTSSLRTSGGAVHITSKNALSQSSVTVSRSVFTSTKAGLYGAAIFNLLSDVEVVNSEFQ